MKYTFKVYRAFKLKCNNITNKTNQIEKKKIFTPFGCFECYLFTSKLSKSVG